MGTTNGLQTQSREQCLSEFEAYLVRAGRTGRTATRLKGFARHFLVWSESENLPLERTDNAVLQRFRDHACKCEAPKGGHYQSKGTSYSQETMSRLIHFLRFLHESGRISYPEDGDVCQRLMEQFLYDLQNAGYAWNTLRTYRSTLQHYLVWIRHSRIPITESTHEVVQRFFDHDCLCPGSFRKLRKRCDKSRYIYPIEMFLRFLAAKGTIPDTFRPPRKPPDPELQAFCRWLRQHRGVSERTIQTYCKVISKLMVDLGNDPGKYTASLIREVILSHVKNASLKYTQQFETSMRMYLRFLSWTGDCSPGLIGAVPKTAAWSLSTLPRYVSPEEVDHAIACCDLNKTAGIRDRAILLLLARLALRAGEVAALQLGDIDWKNARLRVRGKARRDSRLPLPQEVGDAILHYLLDARPQVDEQRVFLRAKAPYRPLARHMSISSIARRALDRAEVHSPGGRGAHLFRHSAATELLRGGASLELVSALLRHRSPQTTAIYAKVDVEMLQEVAQPWMGDVQ